MSINKLVIVNSKENGVCTITLNDPQKKNAMSEAMATSFKDSVHSIAGDNSIRVVVLRGAGNSFSGGGDLEMLEAKTRIDKQKNKELMLEFYHSFLSICDLPVPVIAAINGHAIGAALCLALACDMRIAIDGAKLGLTFVRIGLHPGMGVTYFLPRIVGQSRASELLYTGRIVSATEALNMGLVSQVAGSENFDALVAETANEIASAGPQSIRALRASLQRGQKVELEKCLIREAECQAEDYAGKEFHEGVRAARQKQAPRF